MSRTPLPLIPRRYLKPSGNVDLWDIDEEKGGPVKVEFTPILAREALQRDHGRYKFELPKGLKPGPAQIAADERMAEELAEAEGEAPDPVYGRKQA